MTTQRIGFIGLGNVGSQLAANLQRHGVDLTVRDLDPARVAPFVSRGARADRKSTRLNSSHRL